MVTAELIIYIAMVPVFFLSCWKIELCKYHIYAWLLLALIRDLLPGDSGSLSLPFFSMNLTLYFAAFSWHFWQNTLAILSLMVWQVAFQPQFVFEDDYLEANMMLVSPISTFFYLGFRYVFINLVIIHCFISQTGYLYVEAEMPRVGNEKLLNSLEEGIFIVD